MGKVREVNSLSLTINVNLKELPPIIFVGIEILNASEKVDLKTIFSYTLELDKELLSHKTAYQIIPVDG